MSFLGLPGGALDDLLAGKSEEDTVFTEGNGKTILRNDGFPLFSMTVNCAQNDFNDRFWCFFLGE